MTHLCCGARRYRTVVQRITVDQAEWSDAVDRYPRLTVFVGPTGAGKSERAERAARGSGAPIVVLDRFQVFPALEVGTARGRPLGELVERHFLDCRPVEAGELLPHDAIARLAMLLARLRISHPDVVVEGGSISLLRMLMNDADLADAVASLTVVDADPAAHLRAVTGRARVMLQGDPGSIIDECEQVWHSRPNWTFVSRICGYDAVAAACDVHQCSPAEIPPSIVSTDVLAGLVAGHLAYGRQQRSFLTRGTGAGFVRHLSVDHTVAS